jgi:hypothetical protein
MQLDEVVHADRLLACEVEQVVGHTIVAALLDCYDLLNVFIFGARPLQRHDVAALIWTVAIAAAFWPYRHVIFFALAVYLIGRGWFWLCRSTAVKPNHL